MRRLNARKAGTKNNKHKMDAVKLPQRPAPRSTSFFSRSSRQPKPNLCILFFILIALALVVSCGFLLPDKLSISSRRKFSIVIDGGSTGTRIHVFTYRIEHGSNAIFDFGAIGLASMRVNPGLSAYAENVDGAGNSLVELFEFAKRRVPREFWGETEIRLMATAGLRMLELEIQDRILVSCRRALRESGFVFLDDWASVITGSDEGVYAWVVANYALGTLGGDPHHTTGIIELGGASAQVTFSSSESIPPEFSRTVKFGNITYNLYSHSFLHFGQIAAFESMRDLLISEDNISAGKSLQTGFVDPCTPNGYSHIETSKLSPGSRDEKERHMSSFSSGGNFSECRSAALKLLQKEKDKCAYRQCYIGSTFTPKLQGKFLATENFYYTSKFFGLTQKAVLSDVVLAGEEFCREDWSVLKKRHHSINEEDLLRYCFSSAYIVALLHDSFGIALNDERVQFANQVESIPLDWALGAFILQSTVALDAEKKPNWVMSILSNDSSTLFSLAAIFMIFAFISWTVSKWLKPQLKTIYDLEKGRYIVTRVNINKY